MERQIYGWKREMWKKRKGEDRKERRERGMKDGKHVIKGENTERR